MFGKDNSGMKVLRFAPHYNCGFLSSAQDIAESLKRLRRMVLAESNKFERDRLAKFFTTKLRLMHDDPNHAPSISSNLQLIEYLPKVIADQFAINDRGEARLKHDLTGKDPNNQLAKMLVTLLVDGNAEGRKLRSVLARAIDVGVYKFGPDTSDFVTMPSMERVHKDLKYYYGDSYMTQFTPNQIKSLVIEEAVRRTRDSYEEWLKELNAQPEWKAAGREIRLECFMENFFTGQATIIPIEPANEQQYRDFRRFDYYLNTIFEDELVVELGMAGKKVWVIPQAA